MRRLLTIVAATAALLLTATPALACGGLVGPNGAVNLLRTTTFAGYHDGVEHYVTSFEFAGGEGEFGSIVPLPGVPTDVVRGGDWTLQRLVQETAPARRGDFLALCGGRRGEDGAEVLLETKIDALEITVLRGGGDEVGLWATEHGFRLPPDAPEVLDFYADRSPIFMAARFDADAARERGQAVGDGTPVHLTIPTDNPWVPLRILALGRTAAETIQADVFLLTDERPAMLPDPNGILGTPGLSLDHAAPGQLAAARRPALRQGHGVDPAEGLADQGGDQRRGRRAALRPGHRCLRPGRAIPAGRRLRAVRSGAGAAEQHHGVGHAAGVGAQPAAGRRLADHRGGALADPADGRWPAHREPT